MQINACLYSSHSMAQKRYSPSEVGIRKVSSHEIKHTSPFIHARRTTQLLGRSDERWRPSVPPRFLRIHRLSSPYIGVRHRSCKCEWGGGCIEGCDGFRPGGFLFHPHLVVVLLPKAFGGEGLPESCGGAELWHVGFGRQSLPQSSSHGHRQEVLGLWRDQNSTVAKWPRRA